MTEVPVGLLVQVELTGSNCSKSFQVLASAQQCSRLERESPHSRIAFNCCCIPHQPILRTSKPSLFSALETSSCDRGTSSGVLGGAEVAVCAALSLSAHFIKQNHDSVKATLVLFVIQHLLEVEILGEEGQIHAPVLREESPRLLSSFRNNDSVESSPACNYIIEIACIELKAIQAEQLCWKVTSTIPFLNSRNASPWTSPAKEFS